MPVQGRTRKELRQSIGYNLGALKAGTATGGTTETLIDTKTLRGGNDTYNGKLILITDATDGTTQDTPFIDDYTASSTTIAFQHALSFTVASGDSYEIWDEPYDPTVIHDFINQAIIDVTGQAYDAIENPDMSSSPHTALFADGKTLRFDIPSNISIINRLYYRSSVSFTRLHSCNTAFDGAAVSNFTSAVDTQDKKQGTGSVKFTLNDVAGVAADAVLTADISSKNISKYDYLECWIKSSIATSAGNLTIQLDDTADCATPIETLSIPALTQDEWTYVRMKLSTPELDTAIISIGLEQNADIGSGAAYYVWLDDIKVVQNDTAIWEIFPKHLWKIDRSARDLVFTDSGKFETGYSMLKITGGDKPALISAETTASEVDDSYIIARATGLAFAASSGGSNTDPDQKRQQAAFWLGLAEQAKRAFPLLITGRVVE